MRSRITRDSRGGTEDSVSPAKGKVKEVAIKLSGNQGLEAEGDTEQMEGEIQENSGKAREIWD